MDEYQLNTSILMVPYDDYMAEAGRFLSHFKVLDTPFSNYQRVAVNVSSLDAIKDAMGSYGHEPGKFLRGLRIAQGLTDDEIKLYYVPIYADLVREEDDRVFFDLTEANGDLIHIIKNGGFDVLECVDANLERIMGNPDAIAAAIESVQNYRANIRIERVNGDVEPYQPGLDSKSVFFPFQEIDALREDYGADTIFFVSVSEIGEGENRHALIMSHLDPIDNPHFTGHAADMVTLCPPKCKEISYLT